MAESRHKSAPATSEDPSQLQLQYRSPGLAIVPHSFNDLRHKWLMGYKNRSLFAECREKSKTHDPRHWKTKLIELGSLSLVKQGGSVIAVVKDSDALNCEELGLLPASTQTTQGRNEKLSRNIDCRKAMDCRLKT